jgi:tetratricopeptide (TPR) repeat protein
VKCSAAVPNARPPDEECTSTISPTPEQDLDLARLAIAKGEVRHAAHHLAGVVALDPKRAGLDEALNAWMMLSEDPLAHVPLSDGMFYGAVALHAMVLERIGRPGEAVFLLLQALSAKPDAPFVDIADAWLTPAVAATISGERLSASIVRCLEHAHPRAPLLTMLERIHEAQPSDGHVSWLVSRALRLSNKPKEALSFIGDAHAASPSYFTAIALAAARGALGDREGSITAHEEALRFRPGDIAALLDIGDQSLELGRVGKARGSYNAVLERESRHDWAWPSLLYLDARENNEAALAALESLARESAPQSRARALFARVRPFVLSLGHPDSSIINAVADALRRGLTVTKCGASSLEPPSAMASAKEAARASGATLTIDFAEIPSPDPRKERRKLPHEAVWTYRSPGAAGLFGGLEQHARPGAEPPPDTIARAIAAIAAAPFDRDTWSREARALGERLGPQAVESLLASMVHPVAMPAGMAPWAWRFRVQMAAAFTLLGVDRGWGGSARERGFSTLLYGEQRHMT